VAVPNKSSALAWSSPANDSHPAAEEATERDRSDGACGGRGLGDGFAADRTFLAGTAYSDGVRGPNEMSNGPLKGYAPYVTRILVTRPIDARKFNGAAIVEWTNTSAGLDYFVE
jgi:hypothetical protein